MILDVIKKEIKKSGKSRYQIAQELAKSGVSQSKIQSQLCKIMKGKDLRCETADMLCRYFGLSLCKKKKAGEK
jgi:SOS response regulatory protein OraA/RecX